LVPLESSSAVLVMISSKAVSICNRFHARWANSGKITISKVTPLWCPHSRGISSPSGTKLPRKKLESLCYHKVKTMSLYLTWPWIRTGSWQTDGQTDRIAIANTRSQQYLPVQLSRVNSKRSLVGAMCGISSKSIYSSACMHVYKNSIHSRLTGSRLSYSENRCLYLTWARFGTGSWRPRLRTDGQTEWP